MLPDAQLSVASRLREHGSATWAAATNHPMVTEIGAGTLPHYKFRRYFEQNISYLEEYARATAMVTAKTPDRHALKILADINYRIIAVEIPANGEFLARLGGDPERTLSPAEVAPTTYAYTRHLLWACAYSDCAAGLAALLPCQWSYGDIGTALAPAKPPDPIYADWVSLFGDDEYAALVSTTTALLDRLSGDDNGAFARLKPLFDVSTRYEVDFWDMAYACP
jgi:thiaminase (transcriptional activator TenA)